MKKGKKNILPGAAFAALIAAVVVYCVLLNIEVNALREYEKGTVLIAQSDIGRGVILGEENAEKDLAEREMDQKLIPAAALREWSQADQVMIKENLDAGVVLTSSMLVSLEEQERQMKEPVLAGFKAEDLYQVVSGILRNGDRIHIYTVDEETNEARLLWENILVREVFSSSGAMIPAEDQETAAQRVNVLMEKKDVERFYSELVKGSLRVVKVLEAY